MRNQRIGFVFQNFNLLARTSAVENVELPLLYSKGMTARQRQRRAIELLERVGLGDRLDHHPGQLSGGQQQRVAIARSLVNNPSILMCDEPTGNLDTRTSKEVIQLFRDMNEESGITVILVTHDQDVARCARRVIVLRDGEVVEDTTDFARAMQALHPVELDEPAEPGSSPDPGNPEGPSPPGSILNPCGFDVGRRGAAGPEPEAESVRRTGIRRPSRPAWLLLGSILCACLPGAGPWSQFLREQRHIEVRDPAKLPPAPSRRSRRRRRSWSPRRRRRSRAGSRSTRRSGSAWRTRRSSAS